MKYDVVFECGFLGAQNRALFFKHAKARMRTLTLLSLYKFILEGGIFLSTDCISLPGTWFIPFHIR